MLAFKSRGWGSSLTCDPLSLKQPRKLVYHSFYACFWRKVSGSRTLPWEFCPLYLGMVPHKLSCRVPSLPPVRFQLWQSRSHGHPCPFSSWGCWEGWALCWCYHSNSAGLAVQWAVCAVGHCDDRRSDVTRACTSGGLQLQYLTGASLEWSMTSIPISWSCNALRRLSVTY